MDFISRYAASNEWVSWLIIIIGAFGVIGFVIRNVKKITVKINIKQKVKTLIENNEVLSSPCRVLIYLDTSELMLTQFFFSLNSVEKENIVSVVNGNTLEFTTTLKKNILVGFWPAGNYLSSRQEMEDPYEFEADAGGLVELISKPKFTSNRESYLCNISRVENT